MKKSNNFFNIDEEIGPQVLTMDHLGFIFCSFPLGIRVVLFVAEILISQTKIFWHKLMLLCVVRTHLRGRNEMFKKCFVLLLDVKCFCVNSFICRVK